MCSAGRVHADVSGPASYLATPSPARAPTSSLRKMHKCTSWSRTTVSTLKPEEVLHVPLRHALGRSRIQACESLLATFGSSRSACFGFKFILTSTSSPKTWRPLACSSADLASPAEKK